jgi:F0F1-type ATP synthase membrane subunit c/vacuolar-type H+-ATPase subunit K
MQPKIFTTFILGAAFAEALALIGFVLALMQG